MRIEPGEPATGRGRGVLSAFFGPLVEARTYRAFVYLVLGLPLGVAYFCFVVTMLALGGGLLITLAGLPILALTLRLGRALTVFDLRLAGGLLGVKMPRVPAVTSPGRGLRRFLGDRDAWVNIVYLLLRFPLGVADFVVAVSVLGSALFLIALPVTVAAGATVWSIGAWNVDTQARAWLFVPGGVLLLLVTPHVVRGMASLSARLPRTMVGRLDYRHLRTDVLANLQPGGGMTGPEVLEQLRLYHGASVDCTARKVFAVLSELERDGLVERSLGDPFDRYVLSCDGA